MDILKPRTWSATDIALLKAGTGLFGIAVGLNLPKSLKGFAPLLMGASALLAAKPILDYFRQQAEPESPDLDFRHDYEPDSVSGADARTPAGENL